MLLKIPALSMSPPAAELLWNPDTETRFSRRGDQEGPIPKVEVLSTLDVSSALSFHKIDLPVLAD